MPVHLSTFAPALPRLGDPRTRRDWLLWGWTREELATLGLRGSVAHHFGALHRPWSYQNGEPFLGRATRETLLAHAKLLLPPIVESRASQDGSTKAVLELRDGSRVEAVHMPRDVRSPKVTLCLSSQVGCAMGCTFCKTAEMGLLRNLSAGEIVAQVLVLMREWGPTDPGALTIVFMGMGEPLHNSAEVERAVRILCDPAGLGLSPNRITVSTSGLVSGIDKLAHWSPRPLLALSLNATTDEGRARIMPVTRTWPLVSLKEALLRLPLRKREKITLEYVLLANVNDSDADAVRLAEWAEQVRHNINLIPYNEHPGSRYREPSEDAVQRFAHTLQERGCLVTIRRSRGRDVQAACGQLISATSDATARALKLG